MEFLVAQILSGVSLGGQYALIAIGYTMVYGILRLINFAHGDVFMCAGLMMVFMCASLPVYVSIPLMLVLTVLLGFVIERAAYKPLRSAPRMSVMISAIGVSYLLQNVALYATGGQPQTYPSLPFVSGTVTILGASTHWVTVITPVLVIVLVLLLQWLINHTKIGMAMRAVAKDFETSQLMGIQINKVISVTFIIGSFLAAVGSLLYFTNYPTVVPDLRRHARPEGVCRGGVRRHRFDPRRRHRRVHHRHLRDAHQGHQHDGVLRCVHVRAADRCPRGQAHRPVR